MSKALLIIPHFFDPSYTETLRSLVLAVAECNFKVRILSTWSESNIPPSIHKNVEILQPFKKWNIFEIRSILRAIHGFQPDVVHFVFPPIIPPSQAVLLALPGVLQSFGRPGFILQLQGSLPKTHPLALRYWLRMSQAIIVEDQFTKLKISSLTESHHNQSYHVLGSGFQNISSSASHWVTGCFKNYIYSCGPVRSLAQLEDSLTALEPFLKQSHYNGVVFHLHKEMGYYYQSRRFRQALKEKSFEKQITVLKSVDATSNRQLIRNCSLVSLIHLPLGSNDISAALKMAREAGKKVVVHPSVMEFEHLTGDMQNQVIFPNQLEAHTISQNEAPKVNSTKLIDTLGNQLSRIYQSVLTQNSTFY